MEKVECTIYDCEFDQYHKGVIVNGIVYAVDEDGNQVPAYEYICNYVDCERVQFYTGYYDETNSEPEKDTSKWGYFHLTTGEVVIPPIYDYAYPFYGDRAKVKKDMKHGFIDPMGSEVVKLMWDDTARSLYQGLCWVREGDKYGYIDGKGNYIFEPSFEDAKNFCFTDYKRKAIYAPVKAFGKWSFIDTKGKFAAAFQFDEIGEQGGFSVSDKVCKAKTLLEERIDFYTVKKDGQWGVVNGDFEVIMPGDGQEYVVYKGNKIYIKNGYVQSIRKVRIENSGGVNHE